VIGKLFMLNQPNSPKIVTGNDWKI